MAAFFNNVIVRSFHNFFGAGAGADIQASPNHRVPAPTPPRQRAARVAANSSPVESFYTATTSRHSTLAYSPPAKTLKRKRNDNKTTEFIAMLVEAVDRDAARQDMEKRLAETEGLLSEAKKFNEEKTCMVEFLTPLANTGPSLQRILGSTVKEVAEHESGIQIWTEDRELLNTRLHQSRDQLTQLMGRIYDDLDDVLYTLEDRVLPSFTDEHSNQRTDVELHPMLALDLRIAQECMAPLQAPEQREEWSRDKWNQAFKSTNAAASADQRTRREEHKNKKRKLWLTDKDDYNTLLKHKRERERELLSGNAKEFLIENGLMSVHHELDDVSDAGKDQDPYEKDLDADKGDNFPPVAETEEPTPPEIELWLQWRKALAGRRRNLEEFQEAMDASLENYLYAVSTSEFESLDVWWEAQTGQKASETLRELEHEVAEAEEYYEMTRAEARAAGFEEADLPFSPYWFDPAKDLSPTNASIPGEWLDPVRIEAKAKVTRRYLRRMKRAKHGGGLSPFKQWTPFEPADAREDAYEVPRLARHGPLAPEDMEPYEVWPWLDTDMSARTVAKARRRLKVQRRRRTREMKSKANGSRYVREPVMAV